MIKFISFNAQLEKFTNKIKYLLLLLKDLLNKIHILNLNIIDTKHMGSKSIILFILNQNNVRIPSLLSYSLQKRRNQDREGSSNYICRYKELRF